MTDQAAMYRPSPKPRPASTPPRTIPERPLHVVPPPPDDVAEVPVSGTPQEAPTETITAGQSGSPTLAAMSRFRVSWTTARDYWTPPAVFTDQPASLQELADYAKAAPWTHQQAGIIRGLGIGWYRAVAYPYTVMSRYREWLVQRPGRLLPALGLLKLFTLTDPGHWVVHTLIYPAADLAGHIFL